MLPNKLTSSDENIRERATLLLGEVRGLIYFSLRHESPNCHVSESDPCSFVARGGVESRQESAAGVYFCQIFWQVLYRAA